MIKNFEQYKQTILNEYMPDCLDQYLDPGEQFRTIIQKIIYRDWWNKTGFNRHEQQSFIRTVEESISVMLTEE